MDVNRRTLLSNATAAGATAMVGQAIRAFEINSALPGPDTSKPCRWHLLTRSLLERAHQISPSCQHPGKLQKERTIRQLADASGRANALVIKWIDDPSDAFDYLSRFQLDELLDMGSASFWRPFQPPVSHAMGAVGIAFEVRIVANEILGVDEHDRILMAPKLRAKSQAISANLPIEEVFEIRAGSSQIGWLETSLADVTALAVSNVELLLGDGALEGSVAIDDQLKVFEACEHGLLATWETPGELVCVPMTAGLRVEIQ